MTDLKQRLEQHAAAYSLLGEKDLPALLREAAAALRAAPEGYVLVPVERGQFYVCPTCHGPGVVTKAVHDATRAARLALQQSGFPGALAALVADSPQGAEPCPDIDGCTESNCRRCRTHPAHRGDMEHAGIGWRPGRPQEPRND